jgi:nucleoid-associated protein EbfC
MIFGNLGNMGDVLGKVKKMQEDMRLIKHELNEARFEENSGGVKVVVSGDMELKEFKIDPKAFENCDVKRLEFLISDSVDKAYTKAKNEAMQKFKKLTGGFSIPGLF